MTTASAPTTRLQERVREAAVVPTSGGRTIQDEIRALQPQFQAALPNTISPERFIRLALTQLRDKPQLLACSRESLLGAIMASAQLGLDFDLQHAYLVPYKKDCTLIIGYKGYIDLARRSGEIKDIVAREIHEKDTFDMWFDENGDHLLHKPCRDEDRGKIVGYYGRVIFTNGGVHVEYMTLADIERRKKRSASAGSTNSPWKSDPIPMSRKTVIRAMVPVLPLTAETQVALSRDDGIVRLEGSELVTTFPDAVDVEVVDEQAEKRDLLNNLISGAPNKADLAKWLLDSYGPIPTLTEEELDAATYAVQAALRPAEADLAPVAPEDVPSGPEGTTGGSLALLSDEQLDEIRSTIAEWPDSRVNKALRDWELPLNGARPSKELRVFQALATALTSDDPSVREVAEEALR